MTSQWYDEGRGAAFTFAEAPDGWSMPQGECPYPAASPEGRGWRIGWDDAMEEMGLDPANHPPSFAPTV